MNSPSNQAALIRVASLGKAYSPGQFAIRGVSLDIHAGEFVAVIGRSGAGKSTLLRCMNLLIRPTEGRVELAGVDVTGASGRSLREVRGRMGMIFQGFNLVRRLSVIHNVACARLRRLSILRSLWPAAGVFPRCELDAAFECLKKLGIEQLAYRRADSLSGGQQQRVAIARVLAQEPDAILADEPIASLDPLSAGIVMDALRQIQCERRIPVVVNLHQVEVAREYATRIVGMAGGGIRFDAPPQRIDPQAVDALYAQPRSVEASPAPTGTFDTARPGFQVELVEHKPDRVVAGVHG